MQSCEGSHTEPLRPMAPGQLARSRSQRIVLFQGKGTRLGNPASLGGGILSASSANSLQRQAPQTSDPRLPQSLLCVTLTPLLLSSDIMGKSLNSVSLVWRQG